MIESFKIPSATFPTLTGSIVTFNSQYAGLPLKSCTSLISGYQEGTGIPSPDNVRPLHAWNGANLTACGTNLWDEEYLEGYYNSSGVFNSQTGQLCTKNKIAVKPNTNYYLGTSINLVSSNTAICYYDKSGTIINRAFAGKGVFTTPSNCYYINVNFGSIYGGTYLDDLCVNYPSTDTDYHAYNGNTYTFTFGQSIYQGYIDWLRGVVVGTWGLVDLGSMTYYEYGSTDTVTQYYTNGLDLLAKSRANTACPIFDDNSAKLEWTSFIIATGSSGRTYMRTPKDYYSDATAFKTAMNGVMFAYELATPITIQLSPVQLETLLAENNIWADTGDTTLQYPKFG